MDDHAGVPAVSAALAVCERADARRSVMDDDLLDAGSDFTVEEWTAVRACVAGPAAAVRGGRPGVNAAAAATGRITVYVEEVAESVGARPGAAL